jgi:hypothetical protein
MEIPKVERRQYLRWANPANDTGPEWGFHVGVLFYSFGAGMLSREMAESAAKEYVNGTVYIYESLSDYGPDVSNDQPYTDSEAAV